MNYDDFMWGAQNNPYANSSIGNESITPEQMSTNTLDQIKSYQDLMPVSVNPNVTPVNPDNRATPLGTNTPTVPSVVNTPEEVKIGSGSSVAASEKAIDFNNLDKLEKKSGIIDKRVAARMAPLDKEYNYQAGEQARISGDQAKVARGVTDIEKQKADLVAAHDIDQSRLIDEHNNAVAAEEERGRQRVQSAIDTHQRMLQDYMTSQVDPGMMWKNMTGGEKMGSGLSVFASAFLGAKGIDTPVMTMLDKALDRNIDAQLQNINIKGKALDEQGKMVQMVREQSASDLEAKLRLKDMALESSKYSIAAQMSQYGSKLAELKGQEMISTIEQNQLKLRQDLVKERTQQEQIITGQEIQKRGDELQAAAAARSAKHQEDLLNYQKWKDSQKNQGDAVKALNARAVVDPTDPTKFLVAPENMDDKDVTKAQETSAKYVNTLKIANELMEYNRALGKEYDGPLKNLTADVIRAKRDQLHQTLKNNLAVQWNGTTYSDTWAKTLETVIPKQTYTFDVNTDQVLGQFIETMGSEAATMKASFYEPSAEEQALYRERVGSPLDSIGKIRAGEKDSSNTFAQPLVTGGKTANLATKKEATENQKYFDTLQSDKANKEQAKLSEPEAEIVARYYETDPDTVAASYNSKNVRDSKKVSLGKKQIINLAKNANAGDEEAIKYLNEIANEESGLQGEYKGVTENAKFAQFVLRDFDLPGAIKPVTGQSYSPEYLQQRLEAGDYLFGNKQEAPIDNPGPRPLNGKKQINIKTKKEYAR